MKPASPPPPLAQRPSSRPTKLSSSSFVDSLFSQPYELLFPHPLCFDNHLNCRGVWGHRPSLLSQITKSGATNYSFSVACRLFGVLASLFRVPGLCFQQLPASFCKTGGWVYPSRSDRRDSTHLFRASGHPRRHRKPSERANIPPQC